MTLPHKGDQSEARRCRLHCGSLFRHSCYADSNPWIRKWNEYTQFQLFNKNYTLQRGCGRGGCPTCDIRIPEGRENKNIMSACQHNGDGVLVLPEDETAVTLETLPEKLDRKPFDQQMGLKYSIELTRSPAVAGVSFSCCSSC